MKVISGKQAVNFVSSKIVETKFAGQRTMMLDATEELILADGSKMPTNFLGR